MNEFNNKMWIHYYMIGNNNVELIMNKLKNNLIIQNLLMIKIFTYI